MIIYTKIFSGTHTQKHRKRCTSTLKFRSDQALARWNGSVVRLKWCSRCLSNKMFKSAIYCRLLLLLLLLVFCFFSFSIYNSHILSSSYTYSFHSLTHSLVRFASIYSKIYLVVGRRRCCYFTLTFCSAVCCVLSKDYLLYQLWAELGWARFELRILCGWQCVCLCVCVILCSWLYVYQMFQFAHRSPMHDDSMSKQRNKQTNKNSKNRISTERKGRETTTTTTTSYALHAKHSQICTACVHVFVYVYIMCWIYCNTADCRRRCV